MPQTINTNLISLDAQRNLSMSQASLATSMQRLSSGLRINSAKDDAAGLAIATRMDSQVRGMNVAMRNANDAISLSQTAEGALGNVTNMLQRMRELAVQAANGTNSSTDRASLDAEYQQLSEEAKRTMAGTQFNGQTVLATTATSTFQIGANTSSTLDQITVAGFNWSTNAVTGAVGSALGTAVSGISGADGTNATAAISNIDAAITAINSQRATYGAVQNRFANVVSNLQLSAENQTAARSRIMDADYAAETSNLSRSQILQQAGNAMVAQANQLPSQVLSLLR
ncbi:MAG: flagellin FliC [Burkholderiales bacterium]|nr:flagellin FliC [Burkholderiales bacterium]